MTLVIDHEITNIPVAQIKFHKATAAPAFMYGSENWALNESGRRAIGTAEMRFLRRVSRCTLTDHVHNTTTCNTFQIYSSE
jgi:hypothetical protein